MAINSNVVFFASVALFLLLVPIMGLTQDQYFESRGVPIRFVEAGEGTPVVLFHGYILSVGIWTGTGVMLNLSQQFRVITMDSRGHGRSGKSHHTDSYGTEMVVDLVPLLDWLKIKKAHFVGFSIGQKRH